VYDDAQVLTPVAIACGVCLLIAIGFAGLGFPGVGGLFALGAVGCFAAIVVALGFGWLTVHIEVTPTRFRVSGARPWARTVEAPLDAVTIDVVHSAPDLLDPAVIPASMTLYVGMHTVSALHVALAPELEAFADDIRTRQQSAGERMS
jgi:hypothetical protein